MFSTARAELVNLHHFQHELGAVEAHGWRRPPQSRLARHLDAAAAWAATKLATFLAEVLG